MSLYLTITDVYKTVVFVEGDAWVRSTTRSTLRIGQSAAPQLVADWCIYNDQDLYHLGQYGEFTTEVG